MDRTLLQIFAAEQTEHLQRIRDLLDRLVFQPGEVTVAVFNELLRRAHTLKGASRAIGLDPTERLVHRMESVFVQWKSSGSAPDEAACSAIRRALDTVEDILAWELGTRSQPDVASSLQALEALAKGNVSQQQPAGSSVEKRAEPLLQAAPEDTVSTSQFPELVRVNTFLLDDVVRSASQLLHSTYASADVVVESAGHSGLVQETATKYSRLRRNCSSYIREHSREPEFHPIAECLEFLEEQLGPLVRSARRAASAQQQHSRELRMRAEDVHENACRARMTPAQTVIGTFGAMVRDLAEQEGKQIEFRIDGMDIQADREILQALKDPVMHMLRNAVSHGIESPQKRVEAGKPEVGLVGLQIESRGDRLNIVLADDGRGLDTRALANEAVRHGLLTEAAANATSPELLANLVFHPGITTSATVTNLSGRGMGLSAVSQAVNRLQGEVSVKHRPGRGTTFRLSVPLRLSTQHVLLVQAGDQVFGLPAALIDRLLRFRSGDVRTIDGAPAIIVDETPVRLVKLSDLLNIEQASNSETTPANGGPIYLGVILVSDGDRFAIVVGRLLDQRETLVKESGLPHSAAGMSAGAIPLEDGSVAVMLSPGRLLRKAAQPGLVRGTGFHAELQEREPRRRSRILVVDDSVTTRSMEKSILEAHGYDVTLAVDGLEAWNLLRANAPELIISDISMPRMDGFQLLERIKADQATAQIPVILVTSLESREEQEKGLSLGADAYIIKRKFDQRELLRIVQQII